MIIILRGDRLSKKAHLVQKRVSRRGGVDDFLRRGYLRRPDISGVRHGRRGGGDLQIAFDGASLGVENGPYIADRAIYLPVSAALLPLS